MAKTTDKSKGKSEKNLVSYTRADGSALWIKDPAETKTSKNETTYSMAFAGLRISADEAEVQEWDNFKLLAFPLIYEDEGKEVVDIALVEKLASIQGGVFVSVWGELKTSDYTDKKGQPRVAKDIILHRLEIHEKKREKPDYNDSDYKRGALL